MPCLDQRVFDEAEAVFLTAADAEVILLDQLDVDGFRQPVEFGEPLVIIE